MRPSELGKYFQFESGRLVNDPANLVNVGFSEEQSTKVAPGFLAAYLTSYVVPGEGDTIEERLQHTRIYFGTAAESLAAVEAMFFSHSGNGVDLTANFPYGDKGYTLSFNGPIPTRPDLSGGTLETGLYIGNVLCIHSTSRVNGQPNEELHRNVTTEEEMRARQLTSDGFSDIQVDKLGLGSFMLQLEGVAEANFFPSRIDGKSLRLFGESKESRSNAEVAHGDSNQDWRNNSNLGDSPYRVFNRVWEFDSDEEALLFGNSMPNPLLPTYEMVGIKLVDGQSPLLVDNQVSYGFT
jgi:hypothetical protein